MIVIVDDRLLIEELLVGLPRGRGRRADLQMFTTAYWYYRACRAAVAGAGGHLSGPFVRLPTARQEQSILALLELPDHVGLPDPRRTVPVMADVARRHPTLNLMNLEATAAATVLGATVWLSEPASVGVLPHVLEADGIPWRTVAIA